MQKSSNSTHIEFIDVETNSPFEWDDIQLEHLYRLISVHSVVKNKVVLEVDCGDGRGSALLAKNAKLVVAIDNSKDKIDYNSAANGKTNLQYFQGNAAYLEFADSTFDVVVSFRTLDYWADQEQMLAEISRVLRPDGILIISYPSPFSYGKMDDGLKKFDLQAFTEFLWKEFKSIRNYGNGIQIESLIKPVTEECNEFLAWTKTDKENIKAIAPSKKSIYFFAICAKSVNILMPNLESSAMNADGFDLLNLLKNSKLFISDLNQKIENLKINIEKSNQEIFDLKEALKKSNQKHSNLSNNLDLPCSEQADLYAINRPLLNQQKIVLDNQSYVAPSDATVQVLNRNTEVMSTNLLGRIKRKLLSIVLGNTSNAKFNSKYSLTQFPWLILFDSDWYLENNPDVRQSGIAPLEHFWKIGLKERRNPNAHFNFKWYLNEYEDVRISGLNPLEHYWHYGAKEGRNPSLSFDSLRYFKLNPDVKEAGINPLEHYLIYGKKEGRNYEDISKIFEDKIKKYLAPYRDFYLSIQGDLQYLTSAISELNFRKEASPLISIIIPVYGKWEYTLQCLRSIHQNLPTQHTLEIIVIDDCSPDNSGDIVSQIQGIRYEKNSTNLGFIKSCNYGASLASGKYLYFLNNDTVVMPGSIDQLLETFKKFSLTGLVGSKLIYPNGDLQEAGGIIWQDASGWNFGRNQDPCQPKFSYAREVDFCSGASIMIARELFFELGLFDERYIPAYYEDVDLAFKVKAAGFRVIYQPLSLVIHFEGVSAGKDLNLGMKASQLINQQKFLQRWQSSLIHYQENGKDVSKAKDRSASYRLLVIDAAMLTPNADAGSLLIYNKMILFRELGFQVTFANSGNLNLSNEDVELMQGSGFEVLYAPYYQSVLDHLRECNDRYDVVMLVRPYVFMQNIADVKKYCPSAKVFFHTVDLHFLRLQRESILKKDPKLFEAALVSKEMEIQSIKMSDLTFIVSSEEIKFLEQIDRSLVLKEFSLILKSSQGINSFAERRDILFVGNFSHLPNCDAVIFFCEEVMPYIRKLDQKINFRIGGSRMPDEIKKLASSDVIIEGFIPNLDLKCNEVKVMVAPLRFGAGVKGKVASAIASGLPVVATTIAVEGMHLVDDKPVVLVANDPKEIADLILSIYQNEDSWNNMRENGLELAKKLWGGYATITKLKEEVLDPMGFRVEIRSTSVPLYPY